MACLLPMLLTPLAAGGCSSPSASSAVTKTCQQVGAVLSDGPDPGADPVGYAEAQIRPLRQITTTDASLQAAIGLLANAYQTFYDEDGASRAQPALTAAERSMDAICPGVTQ
jgi:hypothetical protein